MEKMLNALESFRGSISSSEYIEVIGVGGLILYLDRNPEYSDLVDIQKILRAETGAKKKMLETLNNIEIKIPYLKGVFSEFEAFNKMESPQLTTIFYELSSLDENLNIDEWLGEVLEEICQRIGSREVSHSTPKSISDLAISVLNATKGSFYDGVSGYGGSLLKAQRKAWKQNGALELYGQEINGGAWAISKIKSFILGDNKNQIVKGDVLSKPGFVKGSTLKKFDYVFMDAPFALKIQEYESISNDRYNRFFYGIPSRSNADFAFISHALASLNEEGRAIVVATDGVLFRGGGDGRIRENMLVADMIETVISLPSRLYNTTGIPVNLIVFNKNKSVTRKNKVQFIKANKLYIEDGRNKRVISDKTIQKIVDAINNESEIDEFSTLINQSDLIDGNLLPSRYILPSELEIDGFGRVNFDTKEIENINTISLKENATLFRGFNVGSKNEEHPEGEFKIVKLSDVQNGKLDLDVITRYMIENNAKTDMYRLKKGDVILSIRGNTLKAAIIPVDDENLLLSQNFIGIRCNDKLNPYFLKVYLESPLGQYYLTNKMSGTAIATLSRKDVESLEIPNLPIEEQKKIIDNYNIRELYIEEEIKRLKAEMLETKIQTYVQMGIKDVFRF